MLEANSDCYGKVMIWTCSALKNDRLNFSFVKDTYVDGEKLARNGQKMAICQSQILVTILQNI